MRIELDKVVPAPFRDRTELNSEIWGTQAVFSSPGIYQVWAPSGRGKTTFTHIIYGLRHDYVGSLRFDGIRGTDLAAADWGKLRQAHFSIVFQDLRLFPHLTAWENIRINEVLHPYLSPAELRKLCQELSIDRLLDSRCDQMSLGERQRVAVVRAMAQPFEWLLLDEPFSHLDVDNVGRLWRLISRQCQRRGAGCLLMTLDQSQRFSSSPSFPTLRL